MSITSFMHVGQRFKLTSYHEPLLAGSEVVLFELGFGGRIEDNLYVTKSYGAFKISPSKLEPIEMSKEELMKVLLANFLDAGTVDLSGLDFRPYEVNVSTSRMKVDGYINQSCQVVTGAITQDGQNAGGNIYQHNQLAGGSVIQDEIVAKPMTQGEIEEALGYKIEIVEGF